MRLRRPHALARAAMLGCTAAVLAVGYALPAQAASEGSDDGSSEEEHADESGGEESHDGDDKDDDKGLGAPAAAIAGIVLGGAGFAMSEAGKGGYPDEHH